MNKLNILLDTTDIQFFESEGGHIIQIKVDKTHSGRVRKLKEALKSSVKEFCVRFTKRIKERTTRQNALFWAMVNEVVTVQSGVSTPEEEGKYYQDLLFRKGCEYTFAKLLPEDVKLINANGMDLGNDVLYRGAQVINETVNDKGVKWQEVRLFYGSSKYTTVGFNQLIDGVLDDMAALGISTNEYTEQYKQLKEKAA